MKNPNFCQGIFLNPWTKVQGRALPRTLVRGKITIKKRAGLARSR